MLAKEAVEGQGRTGGRCLLTWTRAALNPARELCNAAAEKKNSSNVKQMSRLLSVQAEDGSKAKQGVDGEASTTLTLEANQQNKIIIEIYEGNRQKPEKKATISGEKLRNSHPLKCTVCVGGGGHGRGSSRGAVDEGGARWGSCGRVFRLSVGLEIAVHFVVLQPSL